MKSLSDFFNKMHDVDFPYLVLRNWENLPHQVQSGKHGDLDIMVYDLNHFRELFPDVTPTAPSPPQARHKMTIGDLNIYIDVRYIGDGYYPTHFQINMMETRECNARGFFTPNATHFRIALAYHAVHHKGENTYQNYLGNATVMDRYGVGNELFNTMKEAERYIKQNNLEDANIDKREGLLTVLKRSKIGFTLPHDPTVGRFHQYWRGATSIVSRDNGRVLKKQEAWNEFNLIENEYRILSELNCRHFPRANKVDDGIEIEDCGDRLTVYNLPDDWKQQMVDILNILKSHKIIHRDIKPDNLMVKGGVIKLLDFGWARFESDPKDNPPGCLGYPYRPTSGWDDNFSMRKVIKEFEYKLEEQCVS